MRAPLFVALFSSICLAQGSSDDHDEYGFPITFDAQIITRNVVMRDVGLESEEDVGGSFKNLRDAYLMQRLYEKVGELYGIEIDEREILDYEQREMARFKSEAGYFDYLLQKGLTPEANRQKLRKDVLQAYLGQLFRNGFISRGQRLLPWDPNPTPREIKIAYENDPERRAAGSKLRWRELLIDIPAAERRKAAAARIINPNLTDADIEAKIRAKVEPLANKAREMLKAGKSIDEIGKAIKIEVKLVDQEISNEPSEEPRLAFLQKAKAGDSSGLIELARARWSLIIVEAVNRPSDVTLADPNVVKYYLKMVGTLKQDKAQYLLRLRALEKTDIRPARVKRDLRKLCLDRLRQAQRRLRALGLH